MNDNELTEAVETAVDPDWHERWGCLDSAVR